MCSILDNRKVMLPGNLHDGIHFARVPVEMHRHQRPSMRGDSPLNELGVYVERIGLNVHKHWTCPQLLNDMHSRTKRQGCRDNLIARPDAQCRQPHQHGIRTRADCKSCRGPGEFCEFFLEAMHLRSGGDPVGAEGIRNLVDFVGVQKGGEKEMKVFCREVIVGYLAIK